MRCGAPPQYFGWRLSVKKRLRLLSTLFFVFVKIGLFTLGGGYAMIPLIQREVVEKHKFIDDKQIVEILAVSGSMPGSVAVNIATFIGFRIAGFTGAVAATVGNVLPSFTIIYIISFFMRKFLELEAVSFAFNGIRVGVVALIVKALVTVFKQSPKGAVPYLIMAFAFLAVVLDLVSAIAVIVASALAGLLYAAISAAAERRRLSK